MGALKTKTVWISGYASGNIWYVCGRGDTKEEAIADMNRLINLMAIRDQMSVYASTITKTGQPDWMPNLEEIEKSHEFHKKFYSEFNRYICRQEEIEEEV